MVNCHNDAIIHTVSLGWRKQFSNTADQSSTHLHICFSSFSEFYIRDCNTDKSAILIKTTFFSTVAQTEKCGAPQFPKGYWAGISSRGPPEGIRGPQKIQTWGKKIFLNSFFFFFNNTLSWTMQHVNYDNHWILGTWMHLVWHD